MLRIRLKELRDDARLSQAALAKRIGVKQSTVGMWESGKNKPEHANLEKLAEIFGCSVDYLMGRETSVDALPSNLEPLPGMKQVPLLGTIPCGEPSLAVEEADEFVPMPETIHANFALLCKGDSMIGAGIHDGDVVYIRQQEMVENGEIAAVLIEEDATLKRVHVYTDMIILEPANPLYQPIVYRGEEMNAVRIIGKAVGFTRLFK